MKTYKPTSDGQRSRISSGFDEITTSKPEKSLLAPLKEKAGRNNSGKITVRHRGGGHKKKYRIIDFKREKKDVEGVVISVEYDPNRSARIALIRVDDGSKFYMIAPDGIKVGEKILNGEDVSLTTGNSLPLKSIPVGYLIHNVENIPGKGASFARSAGAVVQVMAHEFGYALIRMPSGEVRKVLDNCRATIGQVGNLDHKNQKLGKAGRSFHRGRRPTVRGLAMNPSDHPHGGGEGKTGIGLKNPKTPWGKPALGKRTRKSKSSDKLILRRRFDK
ncbi:MAG: 50S ribosomal protein L2 [Dehalococcoidia bacterium]|nr:50S ribosomal protein L2 [Dehalococcoidia bacterium]